MAELLTGRTLFPGSDRILLILTILYVYILHMHAFYIPQDIGSPVTHLHPSNKCVFFLGHHQPVDTFIMLI